MALADKTVQTSTRQYGASSQSPTPSASSSSGFTSPINSAADFTCSKTPPIGGSGPTDNEAQDRLSSRSSTTNELDTVICLKPISKRASEQLAETPVSSDPGRTLSGSDGNNNNNDNNNTDNSNCQRPTNSMSKKWPAGAMYTNASAGTELGHQRGRQEGPVSVGSTCPSPSSMRSVTNCDAGLLYYKREPLKLKDFCAEVRAPMDVEQFAHQAELMLDLNEVSMDGIIEAMLTKVVENEKIGNKLNQIRDAIFIPGPSMLMARTIQGFNSVVEYEDRCHQTKTSLKHDQSWLCALANLAQVSKRHMVIARFKHPINMGENAHEVRLFVLIVVPTVEKSTKDQVETGRTFATMLTDPEFRQKLFHAANENEFKSFMLLKAQQLARAEKIKNRHKYLLDASLHRSLSSLNELSESGLNQDAIKGKGGRNFDQLTLEPISGSGLSLAQSYGDEQPPVVKQKLIDMSGKKLSYAENPRTSKLFELISATQMANNSKKTSTMLENGNSGPVGGNQLKQRTIYMNTVGDESGSIGFRGSSDSQANGSRSPSAAGGSQQKTKQSNGADSGANCCCYLWNSLEFGKGAWRDFSHRVKFYPSDFKDAFVGPPRTVQKTVATIWFLYFGILLPTIAFSSLNTTQTHGHMGDLRKAIIGQAIGGLFFALLGGQPLVIIMTTAPLCLYTKVVHQMCLDYGFHFPAMYAAVGLWNGFFLIIYSLFGFSKLMKWCTRSTEEIFALFIVVAFVTDAGKDMVKNFKRFYFTPACEAQNNHTASVMTDVNQTMLTKAQHLLDSTNHSSHDSFRDIEDEIESSICRRETSLLFVLLMLGTLWLAVTLYKFKRTPYLSAGKRDILADYALPTAVILMSLVGSTIFDDIYVEKFPPVVDIHFERARIESLPWTGILTSMGLGFTLSLLFFMDQNISAAMVNAPQNRLKKGSAYHYDLLIVGLLNGCLSLYGLPMMHGVLPHSPLHARSLADIEEQVEEGHLRQVVVNCRETRVTAIVAHILVLGSLFLIPYPIAYIPRAVLNGLFLFMAITSLDGLQVFERILLLVTEQSKYPPNHYIRRCPQRKIHAFTMLQLAQLVVMCFFGFSPFNIIEMFFPVIILLMIPFRHKIVPKYIDEKYLDALDGKH